MDSQHDSERFNKVASGVRSHLIKLALEHKKRAEHSEQLARDTHDMAPPVENSGPSEMVHDQSDIEAPESTPGGGSEAEHAAEATSRAEDIEGTAPQRDHGPKQAEKDAMRSEQRESDRQSDTDSMMGKLSGEVQNKKSLYPKSEEMRETAGEHTPEHPTEGEHTPPGGTADELNSEDKVDEEAPSVAFHQDALNKSKTLRGIVGAYKQNKRR